MNPSPCGYFDGDLASARASPDQIARYLGKLSGPLLDRIDMQVDVPRQPDVLRQQHEPQEPLTPTWRAWVVEARACQLERQGCLNSELKPAQLSDFCRLSDDDHAFLVAAIEQFSLSHRAYHRLLRLARTIADLDDSETIARKHLAEALSFRALDRILQHLHSL